MEYGLGRLYTPDPNDDKYQIRALLSAVEPIQMPKYKYWYGTMFLDQGSTSQCVEYSWHHWVQLGPVRPGVRFPYWEFGAPYREMQRVDEWPGENYDGTSVRAGAKVMQQMGYVDTYLWGWDLKTVVEAVATVGPVVMGTNWYSGMFTPESVTGYVRPTGGLAGGHAWVIDGINITKGFARCKNSWGTGWGKRGRFRLAFEDLERLINEDGEACLAVETAK